jgi:hypothetical protein
MPRIRRRPPRRLVYVQFSAERILARRVATGETLDDVPQAAIDHAGVVVAFGRAAADAREWRTDVRLVNGFSHARCLLGDMDVAALTLTWALDELLKRRGRRLPSRRPDLVLHPVGVRDVSGLEAWGLQRIARLAGARNVRVWLGEEPPYETLLGGIPQGGAWLTLPAASKRR